MYHNLSQALSSNHCCSGKANNHYIFWSCVCSLSYPACNAHAQYYIVTCRLSRSTVFSTLFNKPHDFRTKLLHIKCVFWFSLPLLSGSFNSKNHSARYYHNCTCIGLHVQCRYSCQILANPEFSWQIFEIVKSQISRKSVLLEPSCSCGQTDWQKKPIVAFRNFTNKSRNALSAERRTCRDAQY